MTNQEIIERIDRSIAEEFEIDPEEMKPEKTLFHAVVRDRLELFLAAARDRSASGRGPPG